MNYRRLAVSISLLLIISGCAQGMWVRPGTSLEEARMISSQCDYDATVDTRPSDIRVDSGPHRTHKVAHALGDALVEGILAGIDEGMRKSDLMRKCMMAQGFYLQAPGGPALVAPALVAPATMQADASMGAKDASAPEEAGMRNVDSNDAVRRADVAVRAFGAPVRLVSLRQAGSVGGVAGIGERGSMTTRVMNLPDRSTGKRMFLLGACSAGDVTACVLSDFEAGRDNLR